VARSSTCIPKRLAEVGPHGTTVISLQAEK